jgi:hypothetical protein
MEKEKNLFPEKLEKAEVFRYELDREKGIDIVLKPAPEIRSLRRGFSDMKLTKEGTIVIKYETIRIILEQKGEEPLDLQRELSKKGLFPEGYNFVFISKKAEEQEKKISGDTESIWTCDSDFKRIELPREWENILSLLHEIGHGLDKTIPEKEKEISRCSQIIASREDSDIDKEQRIYLKPVKERLLKLQSKIERYGWAKALTIARTFKKETRIDLLKPFQGKTPKETRENLENYIHGADSLGCVEMFYISRGELAEELKGIFTTKFYKGEKFTPEHRKRIRK